jgi:preprotein translocase subunit SecB
MLSPLHLDKFLVESLELRTNLADPWPSTMSGVVPELDVQFTIMGTKSGRRYLVWERIRINRKRTDYKRFGYAIDMQISGYFSFNGDDSDDTVYQLMNVNGPSILYGIARGIIANFTGMARTGAILLPSVNFVELVKQKQSRRRRRQEPSPHPVNGTTSSN